MHTKEPRIPGIIIAGTGSNTGKTTTTLALLCALAARGMPVCAAKTGPDYIDTAFHAAITGLPAANLDTWMCRETPPKAGESPLTSKKRLPKGLRSVFARMAGPENAPKHAFGTHAPALLVVEGAMGLYDGGHNGAGSTAQLAALLDLPIVLVCSAAGLGQSVAPLVEGYIRHKPQWLPTNGTGPRFLGVICTHVGSPRHAEIIEEALKPLQKTDGLSLLGLLPRTGAPALKSRHLGLVEARQALSALNRPALARWFEENCHLDALLHLAGAAMRLQNTAANPPHGFLGGMAEAIQDGPATHKQTWGARFFMPRPPARLSANSPACQHAARHAPPESVPGVTQPPPKNALQKTVQEAGQKSALSTAQNTAQSAAPAVAKGSPAQKSGRHPLRVGMAWDAAFSFCYADLPPLLTELGTELVCFSPLRDAAPPPGCAALYFPGGYPELHAPQLSANTPMLDALRTLARNGLPIYGECGGYIYLMRSLRLAQDDGVDGQAEYPMAGLLPISCTLGQERAALGYRGAQALPGWPLPGDKTDKKTGTDPKGRAPAPIWVRGHEFHYASEDNTPLPAGCAPLWNLYDSKGVFLRHEGCRHGSVAGTWLHCYPEGSRRFWRAWLKAALTGQSLLVS